jgi:hypothetical protein
LIQAVQEYRKMKNKQAKAVINIVLQEAFCRASVMPNLGSLAASKLSDKRNFEAFQRI